MYVVLCLSTFNDDKDIREHIHQHIFKQKMVKPAPATNLNNTLLPKGSTLPPPNVKLCNIPQNTIQGNANIIDDIAIYFEENNINIDDESTLDQTIEHNDEKLQRDLELPVASVVNVTLANSYHADNIPVTAK